ncbi:MAG: flagella basal body P-ring formation protein FlgA [Alphaproteobacteria bacterium HGW-Alphaproteobacteria-2]|nr:MAG: flagella basal body P-ring formation protein FlgA [Alphaproteobacteria bacterium HGW-Alphaproteobacteria-2]
MSRARLLAAALLALAAPAAAESLVAARILPARTLLAPGDLALAAAPVPGALSDPAAVLGLETRVTLYAGRPIRPGDVGPPALVERNQLVTLAYRQGGVEIRAEGRALGRAALGEPVRVMNIASRNTLVGRVTGAGHVAVGSATEE